MEFSSDDIRSRYSSEAVQQSLRLSKEIWGAYLKSSKNSISREECSTLSQPFGNDDLIFDCGTDDVTEESNNPAPNMENKELSRPKSILQECKSKLSCLSKRIRNIARATFSARRKQASLHSSAVFVHN
jgi:hypothetical protein